MARTGIERLENVYDDWNGSGSIAEWCMSVAEQIKAEQERSSDQATADTQERIDADATLDPRVYYADHFGGDVHAKDNEEVNQRVIFHLLKRQRELDSERMSGEECDLTCSCWFDEAIDAWHTECGAEIAWFPGETPSFCPECGLRVRLSR